MNALKTWKVHARNEFNNLDKSQPIIYINDQFLNEETQFDYMQKPKSFDFQAIILFQERVEKIINTKYK